jgi:hypothetical protein
MPDTWPTGIVETLPELRLFDSAGSSRAAAMAMMEMRTGVHLTREWLDGVHDTVVHQHL